MKKKLIILIPLQDKDVQHWFIKGMQIFERKKIPVLYQSDSYSSAKPHKYRKERWEFNVFSWIIQKIRKQVSLSLSCSPRFLRYHQGLVFSAWRSRKKEENQAGLPSKRRGSNVGSLTTSLLPTSRARLVTRDSIYYYRLSNAKTCLCEDTATDNFLWTLVNTDASSIRYLSSVVSAN